MEDNSEYPKWKIFLDLGRRNLDMEDNISAINALTKSIKIKQDNDLTFYYRGLAHHRLKNYRLAVEDLTKSLEIKKDFYSYIQRGMAYYELYNYDYALDDYNFAYKLFCKNSKIKNGNKLFFQRGITQYELKNYQLSVYDFSKAIKLGYTNFAVFQNRGFGYFNLKKWDNALLDYKEALKRNPDKKNILICYEQLSLINIKLQNYKEIIKFSEKGIALSVNHYKKVNEKLTDEKREYINNKWLLFLGFSNIKLKNYKKAEYWLNKVNFLYVNNNNIRPAEELCRSFALSHLGKIDDALFYFDCYLRKRKYRDFIYPEIEELLYQLPNEMKNIIRVIYQYKFSK